MKALSLWQPWASLLAHGKKQVETRGWELKHRGPLLIHAAKKWNGDLAAMCKRSPFREALDGAGGMLFGSVIGRVTVVACYPSESVFVGHTDRPERIGGSLAISHTEHEFGDYSPGRFAILCADFVAFDRPIRFAGKQGLFDVPDALVREAR